MPQTKNKHSSRFSLDRFSRWLVQLGFLVLFLYPLIPVMFTRITFQQAPTFSSWLLPFDPLLLLTQAIKGEYAWLVIGAPLLLLALTFIFGRSFCGWICPLGTVFDLSRALAFWRRTPVRKAITRFFPANRNSRLRWYLLAGVLVGGIASLKLVGLFDPFVIFQRLATALASNIIAFTQPGLRAYLSVISLIVLGFIVLEFWQPRFWCRNLCPMGALLSIVSRFSLLNRKVSTACNACGECRRSCPMNAIPLESHNTHYADCTFCLQCENECPQSGITFEFGSLSGKNWVSEGVARKPNGAAELKGHYAALEEQLSRFKVNRREFVGGVAAGAAGMLAAPLIGVPTSRPVIRPPGALPEAEFLRTCIICQECIRVCPTGGLKPAFLESGITGMGTPRLIPRQGGCSINPSCPNLCAQVCPVGALRPIKPEQLRLGLAVVERSLCLAWDQGVKCLVCVESCVNGAALANQGRVSVDPDKCTGCGRCETICPVVGSAIRVFPHEEV